MTEVPPTDVPNNDISVEMEIENDDDNENERPPDDNIHNSENEETQPLLENVEVGLYYTEIYIKEQCYFHRDRVDVNIMGAQMMNCVVQREFKCIMQAVYNEMIFCSSTSIISGSAQTKCCIIL